MFSPEIDFLPIGCLCRYFRSALPPNPSPSPARLQPADRGRHFLVAVILRVGVTLLGLGAIATICHFTVPPIPRDAQFESQTTVPDGFFYAGQPAKTMAYEIGCAALPFLLALGWWIARRCTRDLSAARLDLVIWTGLALYFLIVAASALPMFYCPHPVFPYVPPSFLLLPFNLPQPFVTPQWLLFVFAMIGAAVFFLTAPATRHNANRALLLLVALWALLIPSRFYAPVRIDNNMYYLYHLNSVLDALSQVVNGHHVLVDFPHIYGGYIEMLAPIIRLFPRELGTLLAVVAVPNVVATLCLLLTARLRGARGGASFFLCGLSLLGIGYVTSNADIDYGYLTARVFFPPMALLAATLYFRRAARRFMSSSHCSPACTVLESQFRWSFGEAGSPRTSSWLRRSENSSSCCVTPSSRSRRSSRPGRPLFLPALRFRPLAQSRHDLRVPEICHNHGLFLPRPVHARY